MGYHTDITNPAKSAEKIAKDLADHISDPSIHLNYSDRAKLDRFYGRNPKYTSITGLNIGAALETEYSSPPGGVSYSGFFIRDKSNLNAKAIFGVEIQKLKIEVREDSRKINFCGTATGNDITAIGYGATAGNRSVTVGSGVSANTNDAVAVGTYAYCTANGVIAIGYNAAATSANNIVIGYSAAGKNPESVVIAPYGQSAERGTVLGFGARGTQEASTAIGYGASPVMPGETAFTKDPTSGLNTGKNQFFATGYDEVNGITLNAVGGLDTGAFMSNNAVRMWRFSMVGASGGSVKALYEFYWTGISGNNIPMLVKDISDPGYEFANVISFENERINIRTSENLTWLAMSDRLEINT